METSREISKVVGKVMSSLTTQRASKVTGTCALCSQTWEDTVENILYSGNVCPSCRANQHRMDELRKHQRRLARWDKFCPALFHDTDRAKLPCQEASLKVLQWAYNPVGMVLHGRTGTGKTRTTWLLLRRLFLEGRSISILNSSSAIEFASKYSESGKRVEDWLKEIIQSDITFMDDPFKVKLTEAYENFVFTVIDSLSQHAKPMIVTSNDTGPSLAARLSADRGQPIIRRLREFCDSIEFAVKQKG